MDGSRLEALGWRAGIPLAQGLARNYASFLEQETELRAV
jgi:nucleoside-diphosphate-sugar epimerase